MSSETSAQDNDSTELHPQPDMKIERQASSCLFKVRNNGGIAPDKSISAARGRNDSKSDGILGTERLSEEIMSIVKGILNSS